MIPLYFHSPGLKFHTFLQRFTTYIFNPGLDRVLTFLLCCLILPALYGQSPFSFNGEQVAAGTKKHFTIRVSDDQANQTVIPVTVFHGKRNGPVLGITAGVHGYEYAPILAGQKLIRRIDPTILTGTVILVQIANVGSFSGRSPYLNPLDGKNLNRSFPGHPDGSITERIANVISSNIIPRCNYFVDMHGGDAPEDLAPYAAYYQHDQKREISEKGRKMAINLGFDHVIVFKTTSKDYMKVGSPSLYCSAEAFKQGIPAADIECGRLGMVEHIFVNKIVTGIENLLYHLEMVKGVPSPAKKIAFIDERSYITSSHDGIFYPIKSSGAYVLKGMKLGYITDFFNAPLEEIYAHESGIILYILGTPPVNKGETLATIGIIKEEE